MVRYIKRAANTVSGLSFLWLLVLCSSDPATISSTSFFGQAIAAMGLFWVSASVEVCKIDHVGFYQKPNERKRENYVIRKEISSSEKES